MPELVANIAQRSESTRGRDHADAVRAMFDRISPTYDRLNGLLSFGIDTRWRRAAIRELGAGLPAGPLLDLCAGTLDFAEQLEEKFPERQILASDFAREMLLHGRSKVGGLSTALVVGDAMRLPIATEAFAGLVCGFGLRNVSNPLEALREAFRVLAPGGRFVVLEFFKPTRAATHAFHAAYGRLLLPTVGRLVSRDTEAYRYLSESMRGFYTRAEFEALLREAGFSEIRGRDLTFGVASIIGGTK